MDSKHIIMSQREIKRYDIIKRVINKELSGVEASELLNLSTRQIRRLKKKVRNKGAQGLVHKNRGRTSNRKMPDHERQKIINLIKEHYSDFGPLLASEKLLERHKIKRDKGTVRNIMTEEGIWKVKTKKKKEYKAWRQRKASYGEMIQYDGSYEHWFEDRGGECCLLACIDDANSRVWMKFDEHEGVVPTFNFWREYTQRFGKPYSIYVDKFSTYSMNHKLAKQNPDTLTQFQRAMETDLNIEIIHAGSAQAKGRVEKLFRTLQDRLIKELRLNNISIIEEANKFLEEDFLPKFNAKFMVEPKTESDLHKKLTKQELSGLNSIFSRQCQRTVRNDFTINYGKNWYQLTEDQPATICERDEITIEERMDKSIHFRLRGKYLNYKLLPARPEKINKKAMWVIPQTGNRKSHTPLANHPWRKFQYSNKFIQMSK
jgi:transposase-like protein